MTGHTPVLVAPLQHEKHPLAPYVRENLCAHPALQQLVGSWGEENAASLSRNETRTRSEAMIGCYVEATPNLPEALRARLMAHWLARHGKITLRLPGFFNKWRLAADARRIRAVDGLFSATANSEDLERLLPVARVVDVCLLSASIAIITLSSVALVVMKPAPPVVFLTLGVSFFAISTMMLFARSLARDVWGAFLLGMSGIALLAEAALWFLGWTR